MPDYPSNLIPAATPAGTPVIAAGIGSVIAIDIGAAPDAGRAAAIGAAAVAPDARPSAAPGTDRPAEPGPLDPGPSDPGPSDPSPYDKPRPGSEPTLPDHALALLHALRERLTEGVASAYAEHLGAVRDDLRRLAERATEPELRDTYDAAHAFMRTGGVALLGNFRRLFAADVDAAIAGLTGRGRDARLVASELRLVAADDFERELAIGKLAAKASCACAQQLTALDRRLAALLGQPRLESDTNPLSPRRLFEAFLKAGSSSWAGEQLSLVLLETFEHYTAAALPGLYQALNRHLIEAGILPQLPLAGETDADDERPGRADDLFTQLAERVSSARYGASAAALTGLANAQPAGGRPPVAATAGAPAPPAALGQFIAGLTGLQRGVVQAAAALGVAPRAFDPADSALLHDLGQSPLLRWLQPNEALTVDLVALLFDRILSDAEVPDALRTELGRLQVPVLKVALLDRGFFSDQQHPARRLLDLIAQAARGWGPREHAALLGAVRSAVDQINAGFDRDTSVFAAQTERLEAILRSADQRARDKVSPLVRRLEQRDRRQVADAQVADQVARRTAAVLLPPVVARFVDRVWRAVLKRVYIDDGEHSGTWRDALLHLEQLVWSVQPKATAAERQALMNLLPGLLDALPAGMARIGRADDWDDFLVALMDQHMRAIRGAATVGAAAPPVAQPPAHPVAQPVAIPADDAEPSTRMADDTELPSGLVEPVATAAPPPDAGDRHDLAARQVAVGDWVTFRLPERPEISLRTGWVSRYGGLLLFADRPGAHARVLTRAELARELRDGTARLLSNAGLTDRAVAALLVRAAPPPGAADDAPRFVADPRPTSAQAGAPVARLDAAPPPPKYAAPGARLGRPA